MGVPTVHAGIVLPFCTLEMLPRRETTRLCSEAALEIDRDKWPRLKASITGQSNKLEAARPRSPINLWPFFSPSRSLTRARGHLALHEILSSSARRRRQFRRTSERRNGSKSFSATSHITIFGFQLNLSPAAPSVVPLSVRRRRRAETFSFRLVFPKQCGPINYSHARASGGSGGREEGRDQGGRRAVITS